MSQKGTLFYVHFFLFVQKETNQRKRAPEMITSAFFGKMPLASRSQKRLKFAPFPFCHRTFPLETTAFDAQKNLHKNVRFIPDYNNLNINSHRLKTDTHQITPIEQKFKNIRGGNTGNGLLVIFVYLVQGCK